MSRHIKWAYRLALTAVFVSVGGRVAAQTPEGTVIHNTATATYTDLNSNTYAAVSGSVDVTVGFLPGITVADNTPSPTPASPSTADTLSFGVSNPGNGTDSVTIAENISVAGIMTVTGYRYSGTTFATLTDLNTALSSVAIAEAGSITIQVVYDVATNKGGLNTHYTLTATSRRSLTTTDNKTSSISPAQTFCVGTCGGGGGGGGGTRGVIVDGQQHIQKLPGNNYTAVYNVYNGGNGTDDFDLIARRAITGSAPITILKVNGVAGDSTRITLAPTSGMQITVVYNVADIVGATDSLFLKARSVGNPTASDQDYYDLVVVKPNLTLAKAAIYDATSLPVSGTVVPGNILRYRITVTNDGTTDAVSVQVTDTLPAQMTYLGLANSADWTITQSGGVVTANYTAASQLLAGQSSTFEVRVSIN